MSWNHNGALFKISPARPRLVAHSSLTLSLWQSVKSCTSTLQLSRFAESPSCTSHSLCPESRFIHMPFWALINQGLPGVNVTNPGAHDLFAFDSLVRLAGRPVKLPH
ncbi:hypothetical protein SODALDRAFT_49230 [Sodiomyces alkalinus F11]|uniref:Uncharacterized protein n=1 Tax=Sodiomyces alkalinus (strain CBS 110278 / VKM F-3762 / F11) TaxID=1314773 RepID=A0A3N2PMG5_SODAK|nr:hypothetical protein SODALDRAFT_49230 [Sodiomyces alkalinus F11]ROT35703.1 hypothetical protein SODALDRAFT_49230 [Sodiomyces alkalinus F11]